LQTHDGTLRRLDQIDYAGQPAGFAREPGEVVNYVENHDNQTLFDIQRPQAAARHLQRRPRPRAGAGPGTDGFSQGIAYFHAGVEMLRSKSMDRNSYDSGDWFNRLDWTSRTTTGARACRRSRKTPTSGRCCSRCWPTRPSSPHRHRSASRAMPFSTC
jgi:pullulanase